MGNTPGTAAIEDLTILDGALPKRGLSDDFFDLSPLPTTSGDTPGDVGDRWECNNSDSETRLFVDFVVVLDVVDIDIDDVSCLWWWWWWKNDSLGFFSMSFVAFDVDFESLLLMFLGEDFVVELNNPFPLSTPSTLFKDEEYDDDGVVTVVEVGDSDVCGMRDKWLSSEHTVCKIGPPPLVLLFTLLLPFGFDSGDVFLLLWFSSFSFPLEIVGATTLLTSGADWAFCKVLVLLSSFEIVDDDDDVIDWSAVVVTVERFSVVFDFER